MATQNITLGFRVAYLFLFIFVFAIFIVPAIDFVKLADFNQVLTLIGYFVLACYYIVSLGSSVVISLVMTLISSLYNILVAIPLIGLFAELLLVPSNFSVLSSIPNLAKYTFPYPADIEAKIASDPFAVVTDLGNGIGAIIIYILLPIAFISAIGFLRRGEAKFASLSFLSFQALIAVAALTDHLLISEVVDTSSLVSMLLSPIFMVGFSLYILLEVAFQTSYVLNILDPMVERERRIAQHVERIRTFKPQIDTAEREKVQATVQSFGTSSTKHDLLSASYLREIVERKLFKRGYLQDMDVKSTMRLQTYLSNLMAIDNQVTNKLTAKTALPDMTKVVMRMIPTVAIRLIIVVVLAYVILEPVGILSALGYELTFPQLLSSLEVHEPEFRTVFAVDIALIFIVAGMFLQYVSARPYREELATRHIETVDVMVDFDRGTETPTTPEGGTPAGAAGTE